jgi:hypothetical protein|tara:strand:+ start:1739 stop:1918 length:180 start_codon:yes stop_codon:yes gene_type:complete
MLFKIVDTVTQKVILDHFMTYEEAWQTYLQMPQPISSSNIQIEEYKIPIKRMGRDPDLH